MDLVSHKFAEVGIIDVLYCERLSKYTLGLAIHIIGSLEAIIGLALLLYSTDGDETLEAVTLEVVVTDAMLVGEEAES